VEAKAACAEDVEPFDLEVRAGEVVGLVGPLSSSLYKVAHLLAGRARLDTGELDIRSRNPDSHRRGTVGFLTEDRKRSGNLTGLRVGPNLGITSLRQHTTATGWIRRRSEKAAVASAIADMRIDPPSANTLIGALSGGNQQKVLVGRAMLAGPDVYVLCEPTHGVDINTRHTIYDFIRRIAADGCAVIVATIDVDDALAVSDRVAVVAGDQVEAPVGLRAINPSTLLERLS
jgi:ABC-type sugar transport system ATPase subunit